MRRHAHSAERQAFLRDMQVFGESAQLVLYSRVAATVSSRRALALSVYEQALARRAEFPGLTFWAEFKRRADEVSDERSFRGLT